MKVASLVASLVCAKDRKGSQKAGPKMGSVSLVKRVHMLEPIGSRAQNLALPNPKYGLTGDLGGGLCASNMLDQYLSVISGHTKYR